MTTKFDRDDAEQIVLADVTRRIYSHLGIDPEKLPISVYASVNEEILGLLEDISEKDIRCHAEAVIKNGDHDVAGLIQIMDTI